MVDESNDLSSCIASLTWLSPLLVDSSGFLSSLIDFIDESNLTVYNFSVLARGVIYSVLTGTIVLAEMSSGIGVSVSWCMLIIESISLSSCLIDTCFFKMLFPEKD